MRNEIESSKNYRKNNDPVQENQVKVNINNSEEEDSEHKINDVNRNGDDNLQDHAQYQRDNDFDNANNKPIKFKRVKKHGFNFPFHPQQVATWVITAILVITFYLFLAPGTYFIHVAWVAIICIVYGILLLGVTFYCIKTTYTDPTDRNVIYELQCRKEGITPVENHELEFFCDVCESFVHDRTKHCGDCNRCVDMFDHHCKWLNNCVGGRNYIEFIVLITILTFKTLLFMLVGVIFIITALSDYDKFEEGFYKYYNTPLNRWGLIAYVFILLIVCCAIIFFTTTLLWLHIKLKKWGLTAYEYIIFKEDKQERLEKLQSGLISQEQFDAEEKAAMEDIRK